MTEKSNYLFCLNKNVKSKISWFYSKNISKNINLDDDHYTKMTIECYTGPTGLQGPTGATGATGLQGPTGFPGDRFATKTINKIVLEPKPNMTVFLDVEPNLAFIGGNSVIVAEVADSINSELNTFEATIQYYSKSNGQIVLKNIVNIHGIFGGKPNYYNINLDGVDGAPGDQGPAGEKGDQGPTGEKGDQGPTGPSNISEELLSIQLINNTITIPEQNYSIAYYSVHLKNDDELISIENNLKNNQMAIILFELHDNNTSSNAIIHTIQYNNIKTNYKNNILLNSDLPFIMMKVYNINNILFIESVSYYKNNYITV